ncbi:hypothetical protein C8Q76DRAFT_471378 [Earliella scabrosa]|nr:hypothetical protein C8Q76DRAFT_471378 [Earliella scabrosa]
MPLGPRLSLGARSSLLLLPQVQATIALPKLLLIAISITSPTHRPAPYDSAGLKLEISFETTRSERERERELRLLVRTLVVPDPLCNVCGLCSEDALCHTGVLEETW